MSRIGYLLAFENAYMIKKRFEVSHAFGLFEFIDSTASHHRSHFRVLHLIQREIITPVLA